MPLNSKTPDDRRQADKAGVGSENLDVAVLLARAFGGEPRAGRGLPGPAGGIRAVAEGEWAATFTYPAGGPQAIEMAKAILLDCAESVPTTVTVPTTAITPDNAKSMMGK